MTFDWRQAADDDIEQHFNPRVAAENAMGHIQGYVARSEAARESLNGRYDIRFGSAEKETLDLFLPADAGPDDRYPAQVFIHGGYWRLLDKSDHSFAASDVVAEGFAHLSINYDLCPTVTLDDIVTEMRHALVYIYENADALQIDRNRIHVAGHSAGAHLAAMLLLEDWQALGLPADVIKSVSAISGIYEPGVTMHISFKDEIGMTPDVAARNDVLAQAPKQKTKMLVSVGGDEPEGWINQSQQYHQLCQSVGMDSELMIVPGTHHFTVLDASCKSGTPLFERTMELMREL